MNLRVLRTSSGCAIANDVANVALDLGAKNFKLIALDGFRPVIARNDRLVGRMQRGSIA